ncbi:hypothetical protein H2199_008074 [Coniosporium tulheliwenetii]|uniref:Uncharacterized protein n=1 Tax=Coniosporium tulheliwenetii TaxID=3383036 RepID=A0ACC2YM62_9PEZI|nr:hypothetical protein H2199_008074 [Cladosporium sp. JES 115]
MSNERFTCRWAALSLSNIAAVFLPDVLLPRDEHASIVHELVAVSTTSGQERATNWLKEHKIAGAEDVKVYHSWEEMLETGDFDVVYISTPHPLHYKHVHKALECKRNVLVEKPATMTRAQYESLVEFAIRQDVVLMEAMWTRYLPATKYLQEELLPKIGPVKRVYADFSFPIVSPELSVSSRFLDKRAGAGALLDQGVYALTWADIALNSTPTPGSTQVIFANTMPVPDVPHDTDDINTVILSRTEGASNTQTAVGIVTTSMTIPGSNKPPFYRRLQAPKPAPCVLIQATNAQELHVQWYGRELVDEEGMEREEVIRKPVERGWGIWYQADVIAAKVRDRQTKRSGEGVVIGAEGSLRVLGYLDEARRIGGISYGEELEGLPPSI